MNAPTVEERVYLSPWEDGTERPRNSTEDLAAQTESTQDTESRDTQSQSFAVEMEPNDDFFGQSQETDTTQFATEAEFELEADLSLSIDTSTLLDDEGRSAEDVMYAYVEAFRNVDGDTMRSLMTGAAKEGIESGLLPILNGQLPQEIVDFYYKFFPKEEADEILQQEKELMLPRLKRKFGQIEVASSGHVGDEFHFRIRIPVPDVPGLPDSVTPIRKMRKENGLWRIYYRQ